MSSPPRSAPRFYARIGCGLLALLGLLAGAPQEARAQSASRVSATALSNPRSAALELSSPTSAPRSGHTVQHDEPPEGDDDDDSPMNGIGIGLRLGVAGTGAGSATIQGYEGRTEKRRGLHLAVPIFMGGDGFGFVIEPMLQRSEAPRSVKDAQGNVIGTEEVRLKGLGFYLGPQVHIRAGERGYVGIGLGPKFLYLSNDAFEYAFDLYGRVPLSGTWYVNRHVALMGELGLGWGFSGFADRPQAVVDVEGRTVRTTTDDPQFGSAFAWDLSFGVRVP
jgi:hypothetical protein